MEGLLSVLGRLHPIILHLPIGFLLIAFMMEIHDRWNNSSSFQAAITFTLFWGMMGAILAAVSGYGLSLQGGYEEGLLNNHKRLGIAVALFSVLIYFLNKTNAKSGNKLYMSTFSLTILGLILTGHWGGSLTHGSDFLTITATAKQEKNQIVDIDNAIVFDDLVQPILNDKCVRCHSKTKTKGDLLMSTKEGLITGGKTGPLFIGGDSEHSLLVQRIHLPLEEKEHMPPKGKQQLLDDEKAILSWWIKEGADFNVKVKELSQDDNIKNLLKKFITPTDNVAQIKVNPISDDDLKKIRDKGISVYRTDNETSFLEVDLSRRKNLDKQTLNALKSIDEQIVSLHLESSNITDRDLAIVKRFPHLQKLFIQQTDITDDGIQHLKKLDYLHYLNVYGTEITDKSFAVLNELTRLKKVYLWQTKVTEEGVNEFKSNRPKTIVNVGIDESVFGDARLKAPLILAEKDMFTDTMTVELKTNFKNVDLHYTTDGSDPDSSSAKYDSLIVITESTNLKVISMREGWASSEIKNKQFVRVKFLPKNITLASPPSERYEANGAKSLIDLEKGSTTFTDGNWIGYEKEHLTATLDLGQLESVTSVTVSAMEAASSYIFFPKSIKVDVSENGKNFTKAVRNTYQTSTENAPTTLKNFTEKFDPVRARYIRVRVESNLVNPDWHSAPGAPCWLFVDEISVE
jgi:uncharacterized membrane protein